MKTDPFQLPLFAAEEKVYGVAEFTRRIKTALEDEFGQVTVEGEISNLHRSGPGHLYFTLKDAQAQLSAVMFRGDQAGLRLAPADGQLVRASGALSVYAPRGQYQLVVRRLREAGQGALQEAFLRLKAKLEAEGLFAEARKRPLPPFPRHIGLVTSPTGAAIRDLIHIMTRRYPNLHIVLAPCRVQGDGAAAEIAAAIDLLNRRDDLEVLIVGRGGGSLEDLWAFNEETVARAIARSRLPVVSAVGHQTDFTISDFVADLRAPTPSAAAELVVPRKDEWEERVRIGARRLHRNLVQSVQHARARLRACADHYAFREPRHLARRQRERIEGRAARLAAAMTGALRDTRQRIDELQLRAAHAAAARRDAERQNIDRLGAQLRALSPLAVLDRGFSITRLDDGTLVRRVADAAPGRRIETRVADGAFTSTVTKEER